MSGASSTVEKDDPAGAGEKPVSQRRPRLGLLVAAAVAFVVIVVLALALGLGLGLGLKHRHASSSGLPGSSPDNPIPASQLTNVSQFYLPPYRPSAVAQPGGQGQTGVTRYFNWTITNFWAAPDGTPKRVLAVNGQVPGPIIEVESGDRVVVDVYNQLDNGTAIHWHGQYQNGTNWMDGTNGITQCLIPPGQKFTYDWVVDPKQSGTYWWHAHAQGQYTDGLYGGLVIHSFQESFLDMYDRELLVVMNDHYDNSSDYLIAKYLSATGDDLGGDGVAGFEPVPDSGLINGIGRSSSAPDTSTPTLGSYFNFTLDPSLRYRVRLVNAGSFADVHFSIDDHSLLAIEADGTELVPQNVSQVTVSVGQRYSVVIGPGSRGGGSSDKGSHWMRAEIDTTCFKYTNYRLHPTVLGTVNYQNTTDLPPQADVASPPSLPGSPSSLNTSALVPHAAIDTPSSPAPLSFIVDFSFQLSPLSTFAAYFNQTSWAPLMNTNSLFQIMDRSFGGGGGAAGATTTTLQQGPSVFNSSQLILTSDKIQDVDLVVNNLDDCSHPFHLHGHTFKVLAQGPGMYQPGVTPLKGTNPMRRDTITIPEYSYAVIRYTSDNPGVWAFHCHIAWHMAAGLLLQLASLPDVISRFAVPGAMRDMCTYDASKDVVF